MRRIRRFFQLEANGTTLQREIVGGITTFLAMSYIIFVQPGVLANAGMNFQAVLTATCLAAAVATLLMALVANYPVALAPGMGENFFFAYTLCAAAPLGFGLTWQQALATVLLAGVFFIAITLSGLRAKIVNSIPNSLKCSIAAGIGLFITFIGLEYGGLVVASPGTLVRLGDLRQPAVLASVLGLLLAASLFFNPLASMIGGGVKVGQSLLYPTSAPALIVVGSMMLKPLRELPWDDPTEYLPAFLELVGIPLTFSIADGIALGLISYGVGKLATGRWRECPSLTYVFAALFVVQFLII